MRLGTRLLVVLLPAVTGIMTVYAVWALEQRQDTVVREARQETQAYANALVHALEFVFRDPNRSGLQEIINEIGRQPKIYGILVYDTAGGPLFVSEPLTLESPAPAELLEPVLVRGAESATDRLIESDRVFSVLRPIRGTDGRILGALEVAQPLDFVEEENSAIGQRFLLNTLTLLAAVSLATLFLVRRFVVRPMERLVAGARALGRGEAAGVFQEERGGGELADLAGELNRMMLQLEGANARLREAEKMAAIGKLAAGVAHEVAAPLNVISGRAEILLREGDLPTDGRRHLRIIVEQIARITRIVRNLLDFANPRPPRTEAVDVSRLVADVGEFLETAIAGAAATLEIRMPPSLGVRGDPDQLQQVVSNLVLNALAAVSECPGDRCITITGNRENGMVAVDVADTGPGLASDTAQRIFEPFFTTRPGGTGLGLVVARGIAEAHGGTLSLEPSDPPRGARFSLRLPAGEAG